MAVPLSRGQQAGTSAAPTAAGVLDTSTGAFGSIAHLALISALQGAAAETQTGAADRWLAAASDGRLDPTIAAEALLTLANSGVLKLGRVVDAIRPTSHEPIVGYRTLQTLATALTPLSRGKTRDLHKLIELLTELAVRFGTRLVPEEVGVIAARRSSSAAVMAARRLAGVHSDGPETAQAAADAVSGFAARAVNAELAM